MSNTNNLPLIEVPDTALETLQLFLAHKRGNWGPEHSASDCRRNQLTHDSKKQLFWIDPAQILIPGEEFKIVIPVEDEAQARAIYAKRMKALVNVSRRFDFDAFYKTFWLLTVTYPVVRPMEWDQNNVFLHVSMVSGN